MELRVLGAIREVPRDAWDHLVGDGSPFLEWDWLSTLEEAGAATVATGWRPQHVTLWEDGRLLGACPLYVKAHSLGEFIFDQGWASAAMRAGIRYYPKLLVAVPFTPVTGARLLVAPGSDRAHTLDALAASVEALCRDGGFSSVAANFCAEDDAAALAARGWLRRTAWQYHWTNEGFASFEAYLASLRSKRRNQVRREQRALAEQGIEIAVYAGDEIPDALFPRMFALYRTAVSRLPYGQQYLDARFFDLVRQRFRRRLCFVVARQAGEVVAGTFNVQKSGVLYGRYWGTDRDIRHLHFNVCYYAAIEHCVRHGLVRFEPGAGGDFKLLRGFDATPTESMHYIVDRRLADAVRRFLVEERRAVAMEIGWLGERTARRRDGAE